MLGGLLYIYKETADSTLWVKFVCVQIFSGILNIINVKNIFEWIIWYILVIILNSKYSLIFARSSWHRDTSVGKYQGCKFDFHPGKLNVFTALSSATPYTIIQEFGEKWSAAYLNTIFHIPSAYTAVCRI